jgi:hypothetical protein
VNPATWYTETPERQAKVSAFLLDAHYCPADGSWSPPLSTQSTPCKRRLLLDSSGTQSDTWRVRSPMGRGASPENLEERSGTVPVKGTPGRGAAHHDRGRLPATAASCCTGHPGRGLARASGCGQEGGTTVFVLAVRFRLGRRPPYRWFDRWSGTAAILTGSRRRLLCLGHCCAAAKRDHQTTLLLSPRISSSASERCATG